MHDAPRVDSTGNNLALIVRPQSTEEFLRDVELQVNPDALCNRSVSRKSYS
jgi:hypothetical protein